MIIYFSATGNSKYIAGVLAQQLNDTAVDAAHLMKVGETPEFTSDKPYVIVTPVYSWRIPRVLEQWMKKCRFTGNPNLYYAVTCGSEIGAAGKYTEIFSAKLGLCHKGTAEIVMPENYLVMFTPPTPEEDGAIIAKATAHTHELAKQIAAEVPLEPTEITFVGRLQSGIVNSSFYTFYVGARKFYATDACISCGKCVERCMLNNITLKEGKPVWGKQCTHCMACICHCPTEAIEYGNNSKGKRRYVCPGECDQ